MIKRLRLSNTISGRAGWTHAEIGISALEGIVFAII
jgi:hypothetical protein